MYFKIEHLYVHHFTILKFYTSYVTYYIHSPDALEKNHEIQFERNKETYLFLKVCYICDTVFCVFIGWFVSKIVVGCQ